MMTAPGCACRDERGIASLITLCIMLLVTMLACGLAYFIGQGQRGTQEYMRENELRLAAESAVETYAAQVGHNPDILQDMKQGCYNTVYSDREDAEREISTRLVVVPKQDKLYIAGIAKDIGGHKSRVKWTRAVLAKGEMVQIAGTDGSESSERGKKYVWQCWLK